MGFLGSLRGGIKKIGNALGKCVEKIGEKLSFSAIENIGFNLQCKCDFGFTSWNDRSSVERTVNVHQELNKVTESVKPSAESAEAKLVEICISEVGEILDELRKMLPTHQFELSRLEENYSREIREKLTGQVMKLIQPRLSLDDKECKEILNIYDDYERKQRSNEFKEKIISEAEGKFKTQCVVLKKEYCQKMLRTTGRALTSAKAEFNKQQQLLQKLQMEGKDELSIDIERAQTLMTIEKLSLLDAIAFEG